MAFARSSNWLTTENQPPRVVLQPLLDPSRSSTGWASAEGSSLKLLAWDSLSSQGHEVRSLPRCHRRANPLRGRATSSLERHPEGHPAQIRDDIAQLRA